MVQPVKLSGEDKRRIWFAHILCEAHSAIAAGEVPEWLAEALCAEEVDRIASEAGLPSDCGERLLALAVGLHLGLLANKAPQPKHVLREIAKVTASAAKTRDAIRALSREAQLELLGPILEVDDDFEAPEADVVNELISALDRFQLLAATIKVDAGKRGRRLPVAALVNIALANLLGELGINLTHAAQTRLSVQLFEPVREHHGHRGKSEAGYVPKSADVVRRSAQRRRSK